jgi:Zn-dependent peptidase ImmA (M78 family)
MLAAICLAASLAFCPTVEVRYTMGLAQMDMYRGVIVISPALELRNDSERAYVFAHEIGHVVLLYSGLIGIPLEIAVDKWAIQTMTKLGYDCRAVRPLMRRIRIPAERIDAVVCH